MREERNIGSSTTSSLIRAQSRIVYYERCVFFSSKRAWLGEQTRDNKFIKQHGDLNRGIFFDTPCMAFTDRERTGSTSFRAHRRHEAHTQRQTDRQNLKFPRGEKLRYPEKESPGGYPNTVESKNPFETRAEDSRCILTPANSHRYKN